MNLARLRLRSSLVHFRRHRLQLALALLGVTIGVAAVVAVDLARQSVHKSFADSVAAVSGRATHRLVADAGIELSLYVDLRQRFGHLPMAPVVESSVLGPDGRIWRLLGVDLLREAAFARAASDWQEQDPLPLARWFAGDDLVLLPEGQAKAGSAWRFEQGGRAIEAEVAGGLPGLTADIVIADIGTVQRWLDRPGLDRIELILPDPVPQALTGALPPGVRLEPLEQASRGLSSAFELNLLALSLLTALVGAFIVFNTFHFLVVQRQALFDLEHSLGLPRRRHRRQVLGEAAALGLLGGALGALAGLLLGRATLLLMQRTISDLYYTVSGADLLLTPAFAGKALLIGVCSCLAAALWPARRAGGEMGVRGSAPLTALTAVATLAGLGLLLLPGPLIPALAGVFMVAAGYALLAAPICTRALQHWAPRVPLIRYPLLGLGLRRLSGSLPRMLPATAALVLAVATVIGVGTMIQSFRGSVVQWLDRSLSADYYLGDEAGLADAALSALGEAPGVDAMSRFATRPAQLDELPVELAIQDLSAPARGSYRFIAGDPGDFWPRFEQAPVVLVTEKLARQSALAVGDGLRLQVAGETLPAEVGGVVADYRTGLGRVLVSWAMAEQRLGAIRPGSAGIHVAPGSRAAFEQHVAGMLADHPRLRLTETGSIRQQSLEIFDQTFELTRALQWIAAVVALIGLTGALAALQLERRQEQQLLAALGVSTTRRRRAVRVEAALIGGVVGLFALPLGGLLAWALTAVINPRAFGWYLELRWVPSALLSGLAIAVAGSWLAGWLAAGRSDEAIS